MNDKLFQEYKDIKDKIAVFESQRADIELQLFDALDADGLNAHEVDGYRFVRMSRRSYEYSEKITDLTKELSKQKKIEEANETATLKKESQYIRVVKSTSDE